MLVSVVDDNNGNCDEFSSDDEQGRADYDDKLTVFEESLRWPATNSCTLHSATYCSAHTCSIQCNSCSTHSVQCTLYMYAVYGAPQTVHMHSVE